MNPVITKNSARLIELSWSLAKQKGLSAKADFLHFYNIQYLIANYPKNPKAQERAEWTLDNLLGQIGNGSLLKTAIDLVNRHLGF